MRFLASEYLRVLYFLLDRETTASFSSGADLIFHASTDTLAKTFIETLCTSGVSSCIIERMAVHDTIGTPPLNFYMSRAAETGEALSRKKLRGGGTYGESMRN